jgi:predicted RNase H-like HicB family nuclease
MELAVRIHVEQLPEGLYLATSDDVPGLVAQGRTIAETLELARDVARKLIEARLEREGEGAIPPTAGGTEFTIVVAA